MPLYSIDGIAPELPGSGNCWVAPDANLIGRIRLLEDASIWFGCTLRGDREWITIGERSNVQENSVLHTDPGFPMNIGADCTVGHGVILHGCTIGDSCLIGMGAIILNGAKLGKNCLVGAGALVTEGKEFPDGSMIIGSPAKAVRTMDAEQIARFSRGAAHYVENARRYKAGLKQVG
jgi:carbonic anhydrase/acetyltransferase-like protein (isoleucine patch superfamily)